MTEQATDDTAFVMFTDDFGTVFRVESVRIPAEVRQLKPGENLRDTLSKFFHEKLVPLEFTNISPQTTILDEDYVDTAAGKALFAVVYIPHGSTLMKSVSGGPDEFEDSVRGVMIFRQHDFLYILMNQEWPMTAERTPPIPMQTRINMRLEELQKSVAGMSFQ